MGLIVQLSHPLGGKSISREGYWYGFVVHHLELQGSTGIHVLQVDALQIADIGLSTSEEKRRIGGFVWPVEYWNRIRGERTASQIRSVSQAFLLAFDDVELAFSQYKNLRKIDLLIGRYESRSLNEHGDAPMVTIFRNDAAETYPITDENIEKQAAVMTLYEGRDPLVAVSKPKWVGIPSFAGGIEAYVGDIAKKALDDERREKAAIRTTSAPASATPVATPAVSLSVTSSTSTLSTPNADASASQLQMSAPTPVEVTGKSTKNLITAVTVLVAVGVGALLVAQHGSKPTVEPPPRPPVKIEPAVTEVKPQASAQAQPAPKLPAPSNSGAIAEPSTAVPVTPQSTVTPPIQVPDASAGAIAREIVVPRGTFPARRDVLYSFGFDEHLAMVKLILGAAKSGDTGAFDTAAEWLRNNRPSREWPKTDSLARRKFNEGMESLINTANATKDDQAMRSAITLSEEFLSTHFGHSTAHLNLSFAQSASGNGKSALPPAFHTIVFNPDGANSWVAMGLALARSGDEVGATGAFCAALRKVNFSDRTVGFFERISRGQDPNYAYPEVVRSMTATYDMCPRARWAR